MKRKLLWLFLFLFLFVGCDKTTEVVTTDGSITTQEEMGLIELRVSDGKIQWKYDFESAWTDLVALSTLTGPTGEDGKAVMFRLNEGYIQWQREGDSSWNSLFDIDSLQGLGIESMLITELGELVVTYTDDSVSNLGELNKLNIVQFTDGMGNVIAVHLVKDGGTVIPPIAPVMPGHTFIGWSESFNNILVDTSINALYSVNSYNISYNTNGGENIEGDTYDYGQAITLPIPIRFGYKFMGWFMGDTANSPKATDGMIIRNDLNLYARWQKETAVTVHNEEELNMAIDDPSVEEIIFGNDIYSDEEYYIGRSLSINGNGYTLYFSGLYGIFRITTQYRNYASEDSLPSGGSFKVFDLDIIADTGIPDYYCYTAFAFERVQNMDVRFDNISIKGMVEEAIGIYETSQMNFKFIDSFFDVEYGGIGGFMNDTINMSIINTTIKSHYNLYLAGIYNSAIDVYNSEFYIMNDTDEYGVGFMNFDSGFNDFNFNNTYFYVDEIIEGAEGGSQIIASLMEDDSQQVNLYDCHIESNNPTYDNLFFSDYNNTDYYFINSTLEFKEGIINLGDYHILIHNFQE